MPDPVTVALQFIDSINSRSADTLCSLLTHDSVFIDSLGNRLQGDAKLRAAWEGYFKMVPDYSVSHSEILSNRDIVAIFGSAQGTYSKDGTLRKENFWKTPAAWRAVVRDNKIALWQVFADNEPIRALMRASP